MLTALLDAWPMYGVNKFSREDQAQNSYVIQYYRPISKEIISTNWEGFTKWVVWKIVGTLNDI